MKMLLPILAACYITACQSATDLVSIRADEPIVVSPKPEADVELVMVYPLLQYRTEAELNVIRNEFIRIEKPVKPVVLVSGNGYYCTTNAWVYTSSIEPSRFMCYCRGAKRVH